MVYAQVQQPIPDFTFSKTSSSINPDIKRTDIYDYQPSAMIEKDGTWTVWDCGQEAAGTGRDAIVRTKFNAQGTRISDQTVVMKANSNDIGAADSQHDCAPTVVRHAHQYVDLDGPTGNVTQAGDELYVMYYECAPNFYNKCDGSAASTNNGTVICNPNLVNTAGFSQICAAASTEGVNWHKYNDTVFHGPEWLHYGSLTDPPTPVIKVGSEIKNNCGFSEEDLQVTGKYRIYLQSDLCAGNPSGNYGVGQPSAWTKVYPDGTKQVWLWYMATRGSWNNRKVFLAKSWDGMHFEAPEETNLKYNPEVRYYPGTFAGHTSVFIATTTFGNNYLLYSDDGITWTQPLYEDAWWWALHIRNPNMTDADARIYASQQISRFEMGMSQDALCTAPGSSGLLADTYGNLNSISNVTMFSNEGYMGSSLDGCTATNGCTCYSPLEDQSRGSTWGLYMVKGNLIPKSTPSSTPIPTPTPFNCNRCSSQNGCERTQFLSLTANCAQPLPGTSVTRTTDCTCPQISGGNNTRCSSECTSKTGDLNSDTKVDIYDYNILVANFGKTGTNIADINYDQVVDIFDYNELVANFGK